jgi:hypothetical protein
MQSVPAGLLEIRSCVAYAAIGWKSPKRCGGETLIAISPWWSHIHNHIGLLLAGWLLAAALIGYCVWITAAWNDGWL